MDKKSQDPNSQNRGTTSPVPNQKTGLEHTDATKRTVTPPPSKGSSASGSAPRYVASSSTPNRKAPAASAARPAPQHKTSASAPPAEETVVFQETPSKLYQGSVPVSQDTQPILKAQQKNRITSLFKPRDKKPNFVLSILLNIVKFAFIAIIIAVAAGFGSIVGVANAYLETTPDLDTGKIEDQKLTSYIYDQHGNLLATYSGSENRDWAPISEIPENLQNAIIAIEDRRFYEHTGVDFRRLAGAFAANLSSGTVEGGSTITQQLVKNKLLTNERSYKRKLQEAYLAMKLEENYSKDEILEAYLNTIPLGGKVYGVKTAAKDYFGKELDQLNLKEMVCIAAITQSTTRFNPRRATYVKPEDLPYLINRMNMITERMYWANMITEEQYNDTYIHAVKSLDSENKELVLEPGYLETWKQEMQILEESPANETYKYPHFVEYVIYDVQTFMLKQQGLEDTEENRRTVDREMRAGGYKIYATIDTKIQDAVQSTLAEWQNYPDFKNPADNVMIQTDKFGNKQEIIQPQAAAVVVENETGYLRAVVGAREAPDQMLTFNRAYKGNMQIGSSIKPLSVYGPAFDIGYSLASNVANLKVPITGWEVTSDDPGYPQTSTGEEGPVSLHTAIVESLNIAAARTLADYVTINTSLEYLENLGVDTSRFDDPNTGISNKTIVGLALGSAPITPVEVAGAYSVIPRGGEYLQPVSFSLVKDSNNNDVINVEEERERHEAFRSTTAWMLNWALEDAVDHGTGTKAKIEGMTTAGKTGTVVQNKGAFFAGYTPYYSASLWVGSDAYKSFESGSSGGEICAPIWKAFMTKIHEGKSDRQIFPGDPSLYGMVEGKVCKYSNMRPTPACEVSEDWMAASDVPMEDCTICGQGSGGGWYCSESGLRATEYCPDTYYRGSRAFLPGSPYYERYGSGGGGTSEYCNIHTADTYWGAQVPEESPSETETEATPETPTDPAQPAGE